MDPNEKFDCGLNCWWTFFSTVQYFTGWRISGNK